MRERQWRARELDDGEMRRIKRYSKRDKQTDWNEAAAETIGWEMKDRARDGRRRERKRQIKRGRDKYSR